MKNNALNLQDLFLNQARKEKVEITIFLMNGVQLKGVVKGFDSYIIVLENAGKQQMIYKHAVSTIIPIKNINLTNNNNNYNNNNNNSNYNSNNNNHFNR